MLLVHCLLHLITSNCQLQLPALLYCSTRRTTCCSICIALLLKVLLLLVLLLLAGTIHRHPHLPLCPSRQPQGRPYVPIHHSGGWLQETADMMCQLIYFL
jgi:hypothetical protein